MTRPPTVIAIAVVESVDRFLVGLRPPGVALAGRSEFPGGKVLPGESLAAAAVRECLEESGIEVEVLFEYPTCVQDHEHDRVELHFFACRPRSAETGSEPSGQFRWVSRHELATLDFPRGNADVVRLLT